MFAGHFSVIPECIRQRFSVGKCCEKLLYIYSERRLYSHHETESLAIANLVNLYVVNKTLSFLSFSGP